MMTKEAVLDYLSEKLNDFDSYNITFQSNGTGNYCEEIIIKKYPKERTYYQKAKEIGL